MESNRISGSGGYLQDEHGEQFELGKWTIDRVGEQSWAGETELSDARAIVQHPSGEFGFAFSAPDGILYGRANAGHNHSEIDQMPIFELMGVGALSSNPLPGDAGSVDAGEPDTTWDALGNDLPEAGL